MTWCIGARSSSRTRWTTSSSIKKGVSVGDRIVLEGIRQVRDGEKVAYEFRLLRWGRLRRTARVRDGEEVEYEFRPPEEVMRKLRNRAE